MKVVKYILDIIIVHIFPGPSPLPTAESTTIREDQNELTVSFPPIDDVFGTPEKHFGTENNTVVTSQTGSTALLPCVIRNIGDGIVSFCQINF